MSFKSGKILLVLATATSLGACNNNSPTQTPPPDTSKNFDSTGTAKPFLAANTVTQTGLATVNGATHASYDQPSDTITIQRSGTTDVSMTGGVSANPNEADLLMFSATGTEQGKAMMATTSNGDGYAVAYRNDTLVSNPEASVVVGGARSTNGTQSNIAGATMNGNYLGYAQQTVGGLIGAQNTVTGKVKLQVNSTGNGIMPGNFISNRQAGNTPLVDVTIGAGVINGNLEFSAIPVSTTGLLGVPASGTMEGAFYEASPTNVDGEVIGAITLQGGNLPCVGPNIAVNGAICVLETGVFVAK